MRQMDDETKEDVFLLILVLGALFISRVKRPFSFNVEMQ